jgi:DNA ligase-1
MEIIKILKELSNSSGNHLQDILKENENNEDLKDLLFFLYNPYIITGLSSKKINKVLNIKDRKSEYNTFKDICEYLKVNYTGKDENIAVVQNFIKNQPIEYQEIYKKIFTKELKLGITAKTVNKVWGHFIPDFNVMLAEKYWDRLNELEKENPKIILTQKLDGIRCLGVVNNKNVILYSRQGQMIEGLKDIENELSKCENGIYDGELLKNDINKHSKDIYRDTVTIVNSKQDYKKNIIFNVFDYCSDTEDFYIDNNDEKCIYRKERAADIIDNKFQWIKTVPIIYYGNYDKELVLKELDNQIKLGHEGLMLNYADKYYKCNRNRYILKIKKMQSADLKIIGFEEGNGKNKNTLGNLIVNYKGFNVGVGSGFTDEDREYIWKHKQEVLGTIVEISYFEETNNKKDNSLSLRFPVFKRFRNDKDTESYY